MNIYSSKTLVDILIAFQTMKRIILVSQKAFMIATKNWNTKSAVLTVLSLWQEVLRLWQIILKNNSLNTQNKYLVINNVNYCWEKTYFHTIGLIVLKSWVKPNFHKKKRFINN